VIEARALLGDVNGDGIVDAFDLTVVAVSYGAFEGQPGFDPDADLTDDGIVDIRDLYIVSRHLGETDQ